jgi:magnesium chelatase subunit D
VNPAPRLPFTAVVGHDEVKLALLLSALDPSIGGVLLRGEKGSAKSTLARGLAALLGDAPFVELPIGATEDRVVGSIDVAAALTGGEVRFAPGLLAAADGGVLYVDEVNLLPDHLVDVLLDVAASGVNRVEREGVGHTHPSRFALVGSMNPEEGELRPQLLDRFGLCVEVGGLADPSVRAAAVARRLAFDADPPAVLAAAAADEADLEARLATARPARLPSPVVAGVARLCASVGAEGLRADLTICRAAAALAGWEGRDEATAEDVRRVAPLALVHRRRRSALDSHGGPGDLDDAVDDAFDDEPADASVDASAHPPADGGPGAAPADGRSEAAPADDDDHDGDGDRGRDRLPDDGPEAGRAGQRPDGLPAQAAPGATPTRVVRLDTAKAARPLDAPSGRRSVVEGPRGRVVGSREPTTGFQGIAVAATARAASARRAAAPPGAVDDAGPLVTRADLREAVRHQRAGSLVVICVDSSASMGAQRRIEAAKGAVLSLLVDAYQRRDQVALVTVGGEGADVALRPTGSVEVARARLEGLVTGGRTNLAAGLRAALAVCSEGPASGRVPLLVVVSDGRATAGPPGADPVVAAMEAAAAVRAAGVAGVVVDVEDGVTRLGLGRDLAAALRGRHLPVTDLDAGALHEGVLAALGR